MTSMAGRDSSVRDVTEALCELRRKMSLDDAPGIIKDAVLRMLDDSVAKQRVDLDAVDNGSKINTLENLVAYIRYVAGPAYDTRHQRAQNRVREWAAEAGLTMPSVSSAVPF